MKPSCTADCTLAYLDFMNWDKSRLDWAGVPITPLTLLFSGNGSFLAPYYLDPSDPLVEAIGEMLTRTGGNPRRLDRFVQQINAHLNSLSFYDVRFIFLASLKKLVEFNDKVNFAYFWPNNYHLNLIGYYVSQVTGMITLQNIHTHNYKTIGLAIASSVKRGMDAKIGIRIES